MNATESIARFIANTTYEDIPRPVLDATRTIILDGVANILAGSRQPVLEHIRRYVERLGGRPECTVVGASVPHQPAVRGFRQRRGHARSRLRAPGHSFHSRHVHAAAGHTRARRGERRFGARRRDSVRRGMGSSAAHRHGGAQARSRVLSILPASTARPRAPRAARSSSACRRTRCEWRWALPRRGPGRSTPTTGP